MSGVMSGVHQQREMTIPAPPGLRRVFGSRGGHGWLGWFCGEAAARVLGLRVVSDSGGGGGRGHLYHPQSYHWLLGLPVERLDIRCDAKGKKGEGGRWDFVWWETCGCVCGRLRLVHALQAIFFLSVLWLFCHARQPPPLPRSPYFLHRTNQTCRLAW